LPQPTLRTPPTPERLATPKRPDRQGPSRIARWLKR
jgi:hypothetical protein